MAKERFRDMATSDAATNQTPRSNILVYVLVCVLAGLVVMFVVTSMGPPSAQRHPWVGNPIPSVPLQPLLNADQPFQHSQFQGKVTLVNFWGPWCPPCRAEFPQLLKIRQSLSLEEDFQLLSIAADGNWAPGTGEFQEDLEYLEPESQMVLAEHNTDLPVYVDQQAELRTKISEISPFKAYPTTLLVGRTGQIEAVWVGYEPDARKITSRIHEALK